MNIENMKFGNLTVIKYCGKANNRKSLFLCKCDCGNEIIVKRNSLVTGHTKSCGCIKKELDKTRNKTHGLRYTKLYTTWLNIKDRCNNTNNTHYKHYGGKNIKMCEEWSNSFKCFYDWSYSNGYKEGLSIERTNNNIGYQPSNCSWIPVNKQQRNRSTCIYQIVKGEKLLLADIARKYNIKPPTIYSRYRRGKRNEELI